MPPRPRAAALGVLAVLMLQGCSAANKPDPAPTASKAPEKISFTAAAIRAIDEQDRPEAKTRADEEAKKVLALLEQYYRIAFVDPAAWNAGAHPALAALFTAEVQGQVAPNMGALALADIAPRLKAVDPTKEEATSISVLFETDLTAPAVFAQVNFEANGRPIVSTEPPVAIAHKAQMWFLREGEVYKITAITTELKADSRTKSSAMGTAPGVTL